MHVVLTGMSGHPDVDIHLLLPVVGGGEIHCHSAVGGFDNLTDDSVTYPRMILKWYMSDDCPEPLNAEVYQQVMRENDERVFRAIWRRIHSRIY